MTLATSDGHGRPWASPVWFATTDYRELVWASKRDARHSRNLSSRPEVGIVIFDSTQPPSTGEAVYLSAHAEQVPESELERCLEIYAAASEQQGLDRWGLAQVQSPARHRLYWAIATEYYVLSSGDERMSVVMP